MNCTALSAVELSASLHTIGRDAFNGCTGLAKMGFPEGLLEVQTAEFYNCTNLAQAELSDSVTTLWESAF